MKVALITPYYREETRGNAVTVRRIELYLLNEGCAVRHFSLDEMSAEEILTGIGEYAPDLLHAFHGLHCGRLARHASELFNVPYLITLTGTDIYGEFCVGSSDQLAGVLANASLITVFHELIKERLTLLSPLLEGRCKVVSQAVCLPEESNSIRQNDEEFTFFLPGGIRGVKNPLFALAPLARLYEEYPRFRLKLVGRILEPDCGKALVAAIDKYPFALWLGEVPRSQMTSLYLDSSVVLNTSLSEGGMANSLLEAMACGVAVLTADIEGNRSLVKDGINGLTYSDEADFIARAKELLLDSSLRKRLSDAGKEYVREHCSPVVEARRYLELYKLIPKEHTREEKQQNAHGAQLQREEPRY